MGKGVRPVADGEVTVRAGECSSHDGRPLHMTWKRQRSRSRKTPNYLSIVRATPLSLCRESSDVDPVDTEPRWERSGVQHRCGRAGNSGETNRPVGV